MALKDDILAKFPDLAPATRDDGAIAAAMSEGRTKKVTTLIGFGTVMDALGPTEGAALLGTLRASATDATSPVYWAFGLLGNSNLDIALDSTQAQIAALVQASAMTQAQADKLFALAVVPDPVTPQQVATALQGVFDHLLPPPNNNAGEQPA